MARFPHFRWFLLLAQRFRFFEIRPLRNAYYNEYERLSLAYVLNHNTISISMRLSGVTFLSSIFAKISKIVI